MKDELQIGIAVIRTMRPLESLGYEQTNRRNHICFAPNSAILTRAIVDFQRNVNRIPADEIYYVTW